MGHHHHHHFDEGQSLNKLILAVVINVGLTVIQFIAGIISGSLSLVADALHNLSDAGALVVAIVARIIGQKPATSKMTYGYKRAEIIAVLINSASLVIIGVYLIYESITRYLNPEPIDGLIVIWVATIALVIDLLTAYLTFKSGAKHNMNIKAAFIHNISDAMASVVVIISGCVILLYQWYWVDLVATILISIYVIYHGALLLKQSGRMIMQAVPSHLDLDEIKRSILTIDTIKDATHLHIWQLDEHLILCEAHIQVAQIEDAVKAKHALKHLLEEKYHISHSTIEVDTSLQADETCSLVSHS